MKKSQLKEFVKFFLMAKKPAEIEGTIKWIFNTGFSAGKVAGLDMANKLADKLMVKIK